MCGICGNVVFSSSTSLEAAHLRVKVMLRSLSHRGPDATSQVDTDLAVFGATRLAIRGLTDQLNQPMVDAASGVIAVCNGEIDNHRELRRWLAERGRPVQQETDVAVIPGLYLELGEAFAKRLVGAFAIAVWDSRSRCLTLVRDRAGERPLFYARNRNEIILRLKLLPWSATVACGLTLTRRRCESISSLESFPHRTRRSAKSGRSRLAN